MAKKDPGVLSAILSAQKEKTGVEGPSLKSVEDALSGVSTISAADLKAILSGGSIGAPANNVIEIAQDIKQITENTDIEAKESEKVSDNIEQLVEIQQDLLPTKEEKTEEIELFRDQNDILSKIEENTRSVMSPQGIVDSASTTSQSGGASTGLLAGAAGLAGGLLGGGLLGGGIKGIMGLFGKGAGAAVGEAGAASVGSTLIKGITGFIGNIFKTLMKGAIITMLVGGLINGLMDGIEEYKKSGDISKALWKGFAGFIEFLSLGLIDEETLNNISENVKKEWDRFYSDITGFIESLVSFFSDLMPDSIKNLFKKTGTEISSAEHVNPKTGEVDFNVKKEKGVFSDVNTINYKGKEYKVTNETYETIKGYMDKGDYTHADYLIKNRAIKEDKEVREKLEYQKKIEDIKIDESKQLGYDLFGNEVPISPKENTTAENVITQNEENALIQQNMMATGAPSTIYAPTTNNNNSKQTTIMPPIKVRNDEDPMMKILMGEGSW